MIVGLLACTQAVDDSTEGADNETESTAEAVAVTSTPGKAVWTKVWRSTTSSELIRALDVATDDTGAAFVVRLKTQQNGYSAWADVARYSSTGSLSYRVTLPGYDMIPGVHVAARGGRVVAIANRGAAGLVTVLDAASGNIVRALQLTAAESSAGYGIVALGGVAVHDDGGFVVTAAARGAIDWGNGSIADASPGNGDAVVARFDSSGNLVVARRFEGTNGSPRSPRMDSSGNIYVTSRGHLTATTTQTNHGVSKLTRSLLISDYFFVEGNATITTMDVSRGGRVTFGGMVYGDASVGPSITLHNSNGTGSGDPYVAKLDTSLNAAYAGSFANTASSQVSEVRIDSYGQVVAALNFGGSLTIGGTTYTAPGEDTRLALVKPSATSFSPRWTKVYAATGAVRNYVQATGLAIANTDRILMTGEFRTDLDLGRGVIDGSDAGTTFLARLYQ
jgi:hypothetical protein